VPGSDLLEEHGRTHGLNVLDTTKDGDTRETNVQAVVSILVPNEARNP
jgi:type IV secretory pathway TraG/TraD family ATPase VirD4